VPKITINKESFKGRDGTDVEYERLVIASDNDPDVKLELRLDATQLTLAKLILGRQAQQPAPQK